MLRQILFALLPFAALAQTPVFMEPTTKIDTSRAELDDSIRTFRQVDSARYLPWLQNESARRALRLYAQAYRILEESGNPQKQPREYYIALLPGGNHAAVGFRLETSHGVEEHPNHAFILLDAAPWRFEGTLLHETGHVAMNMLAGGKQLPRADVCSIPHSTAALTDRASAFAEGYAIHLETLAAHTATDAFDRGRFFHEQVLFGGGTYALDEYFRQASDLATYSQNIARYTEVRDNSYAFQPAFRGQDYLRVQLEKARDFAELRSPNQLLQSEGFYASFFFLFLMRGEKKPPEEIIAARQEQVLRAMRAMFGSVKMENDTPWLIHFVLAYLKAFPDEKAAIITALNELSHGAFVDPRAAAIWRAHYLAALRLDLEKLKREDILAARHKWDEQVGANPAILLARLAPQVRCQVKSVQVKLEALGEAASLEFDVNTVPEPIMRLMPGITEAQVGKWVAARPFATPAEFQTATGISACAP